MNRWVKRLLIAAGIAAVLAIGLFIAAGVLAKRYEPLIRQQAIDYLEKKFKSRVEIADLKVHLPGTSPVRLLMTRGRNSMARVVGRGIVVRYLGRTDIPPMLEIGKLEFGVDLGTVFEEQKKVPFVLLDDMNVVIPPKGQRPDAGGGTGGKKPNVVIERVDVNRARLSILPQDRSRKPLDFDIERLKLLRAGTEVAMKYDADMTNPKPPGRIKSNGTFGPWNTDEPGDTPLKGDYVFENADLGVFDAIAGILKSTGSFEGTLDSVNAKGEASVPDFRLKMAGNRVPLWTRFEVLVDGTNGNTVLKPVVARLGSTNFTTNGGVIRHEGERRKSINLDVTMPRGQLRDLLRLAMKGPAFMEGQIALKTRIDIPPLSGKVKEKLKLDGRFTVLQGHFLRTPIQDKVDEFSRKAQGRPEDLQIDEVFSKMTGGFHLESEVLTLRGLEFEIPGANVNLAGNLNIGNDQLDLRGTLKLKAKVSQTMKGWKRWALKPVDPFFAKNGAGTFLNIKVEGSSKEPKFGLSRGGGKTESADRKR